LICLIIFGKEYKIWSSSLCIFLHSPATSSRFGPNRCCKILITLPKHAKFQAYRKYEDDGLLGRSATQSFWSRLKFQRWVMPLSLGWLSLHHHPDGDSTHLRNVSLLQRDYKALYPRRLSSSLRKHIFWYQVNIFNYTDWHNIATNMGSSRTLVKKKNLKQHWNTQKISKILKVDLHLILNTEVLWILLTANVELLTWHKEQNPHEL
jgi:hypothetical protein